MNTYRKYRIRSVILPLILMLSILPWEEARSVPVARTSLTPVNPSASAESRELLKELVELSGKGIISGQHDYLEQPDEFNAKLKTTSGQYAVMHGYELGAINNQSGETIARQRQSVVDSAKNWHKNGGIVAMTFHQNLPGTSPQWSNVSMSLSQNEFNKYVTPGTAQNKALLASLDEVAYYLKQLRDAGVPVIWRPYHEMNGDWFWWGGKSNFTALWNIMYDRFVNTHKLNNLLWAWNPNAPNEWSDPYQPYYPGADKVDILAADIYNNDFKQSYYDSLLALADGKPIGIGESGELPDPALIAQAQGKWVYIMTWGKMLTENNSTQQIKSFMTHNYTLSRDDFKVTIPAKIPVAAAPRNALRAEYYNNADLAGTPALVRNEQRIDFNWRGGSPVSGLGTDSFSIRFLGKIKPQYSEKYTFYASSDDGVRVWVGGKLIINSWKKQSGVTQEGDITLTAGTLYDIKVEYFENHGDASIRLMWKSPHQQRDVVSHN